MGFVSGGLVVGCVGVGLAVGFVNGGLVVGMCLLCKADSI